MMAPSASASDGDSDIKQQRQQPSRSAMQSTALPQFSSHGRGGAGNMADARQSPKLSSSDLQTPTLKTAVVTTGRGGTGNMTKNDDPYETRLRQDVQG
ncbi:hypothetical protein CDD83_1562 [Cordyceps sp. RAO-2017]|nr:hypothetical protein CDD83_1562 [Cordyceps sp. RAO-2017]